MARRQAANESSKGTATRFGAGRLVRQIRPAAAVSLAGFAFVTLISAAGAQAAAGRAVASPGKLERCKAEWEAARASWERELKDVHDRSASTRERSNLAAQANRHREAGRQL